MTTIGMIQGRLTPPPSHRIQAFPKASWQAEFDHARDLGIEAIEWLFEEDDWQHNPLWSDDGIAAITSLMERTGVRISSICADYFMPHPFFRAPEAEKEQSSDILCQLIERAARIDARTILLPVLEEAEIKTDDEADELLRRLEAPLHAAAAAGVHLGLETELPVERYQALVEDAGDPHLGVYFDVGNATAKGYDAGADIRALGAHLVGVHLKDRKRDGVTLPLGDGDTDYDDVFRAIVETGYEGALIMQPAFGADFIAFAERHTRFVSDGMNAARASLRSEMTG